MRTPRPTGSLFVRCATGFDVCTAGAYTEMVAFEWDEDNNAGINFRKHGVRMPEEISVLDDPHAITITDDESQTGEREHSDHFGASR